MSAPVRSALLALALLVPATAAAQPVRVQIHDPFYEGGRFTLRNLQLDGRGASLELKRGARVNASIDLVYDCRDCGGSVNQVIIGLAGEPGAQACIYSGGGRSAGWSNARFTLDIPDRPGVYEVRARYAQARSCGDALAWWRTDRPQGPGPDSTIGVVVVKGDFAPPPPVRPRRELREVQRDIDAKLAELEQVHAEIVDLAKRPANAKRQRTIRDLGLRATELTYDLQDLQDDLGDLIWEGRSGRPDRPVRVDRPGRPGRGRPGPVDGPRVVPPEIIVVTGPPPGPRPLTPHEQQQLLGDIDRATFPQHQLNALQDAINAGAYFTIGQALEVMSKFAHETHKVDVGARLCPRIVEDHALPRLLGAFVFESYKQELRDRTGNQCGWVPGR